MGGIGIERKRAVNRARSCRVLSGEKRYDLASHPKSIGVIPARFGGLRRRVRCQRRDPHARNAGSGEMSLDRE